MQATGPWKWIGALAISALCCAVVSREAAHAQEALSTNGPVALEESGGKDKAEPGAGDATRQALPGADDEAGGVSALPTIGPMSREKPAPANELKTLGAVKNKVGGSSLVESAEHGRNTEGGGVMAALDPRQNEVTRVLAALAAVVGLMFLARFAFKRSAGALGGGERPSGVVEILARYPIGRGQQLILLKLARRVVLLHQSGSTMSALTQITEPDEVAGLLARMEAGANAKAAAKFRATLHEFEAQHERAPSPARNLRTSVSTPAAMEMEVVDLTRTQMKGLGGLFGRKAAR